MSAAPTEVGGGVSQTTEALQAKLEETKISEEKPVTAEQDDQDDQDDDEAPVAGGDADKKKKKKKSGNKKKKSKTVKAAMQQTDPPTIGLTKMFPNGQFPVGEIQPYDESKFLDESRKRETGEERRERERLVQQQEGFDYNIIRRAAEVHRQVRQYAQRTIKPGMSMTDIANMIEDGTCLLYTSPSPRDS